MRHVLYVDGLSKAITVDQLKDVFAIYGQVPWARVARHRDKSASYGFVELTSGVQALRALVELDGTIVDDSCLQVYLTPLQSRTNGFGTRSSNGANKEPRNLNMQGARDDIAAVIGTLVSMADTECEHLSSNQGVHHESRTVRAVLGATQDAAPSEVGERYDGGS